MCNVIDPYNRDSGCVKEGVKTLSSEPERSQPRSTSSTNHKSPVYIEICEHPGVFFKLAPWRLRIKGRVWMTHLLGSNTDTNKEKEVREGHKKKRFEDLNLTVFNLHLDYDKGSWLLSEMFSTQLTVHTWLGSLGLGSVLKMFPSYQERGSLKEKISSFSIVEKSEEISRLKEVFLIVKGI